MFRTFKNDTLRRFSISRLLPGGLLIVALFITSAHSTASNNVFLELGGNGILYSINYDRLFTPNVSGRIGFMYYNGMGTDDEGGEVEMGMKIIPIMVNYLAGSGNHKFEMGGGLAIAQVNATIEDTGGFSGSGVLGTASFAYRYQPRNGGFHFRIGLTPFFGEGGGAPIWPGLSLGFAY